MKTEFSSGLGWSCKKGSSRSLGAGRVQGEGNRGRGSSYSPSPTRGSPGILKAQTLQGMWSHPTWKAK